MPEMSRPIIAAVGLLLGALAGACGSSSSTSTRVSSSSSVASNTSSSAAQTTESSATQATVDACALLPKADAEAVAGTPLDPGEAGNPSNPSCTYNTPSSGPTAQVTIYVGDGAKKTYDIDQSLMHTFMPAPAVTADESWEEDNAIFFRKGSTWVQISLVRLNDPSENRMPLEQAAQKVASRL
jgi:Protein of unknown function (DUF3558)